MKIGIQTWGSRGDINPWIALGQALADAGHNVILLYTHCFGELDLTIFSKKGLNVISTSTFSGDKKICQSIPSKKIYKMDELEFCTYMDEKVYTPFTDEIITSAEWLCLRSELIIGNPLIYQTNIIAEKHNIPFMILLVDNTYTPSKIVKQINTEVEKKMLGKVNNLRKKMELPECELLNLTTFTSPILNLIMYSRIFGSEAEHWGENFKICGFLELDQEHHFSMPETLQSFLDAGTPPLFFSMGSMAFFEGEEFEILQIFLDAIELSGCRAIIQAKWDSIKQSPPENPNIYRINFIPHPLILPHCLGIVHHGGAGTTHTTIACATPSIVIAYAWDQFYWGMELIKLGMGVGMLKRTNVDSIQLAGEIRKLMNDPEFKEKANDVKRKFKREKGIKRAVKLIEEYMAMQLQTNKI